MTQEDNKDQNFESITSDETNTNPESQGQEQVEVDSKSSEIDALKAEAAELKDKYLRLYSEFDNFRRRTSKEKTEFFKTANEDLMQSLLPVLDDFERAQKAMTDTDNTASVTEGINLIFNKLFKNLEVKGLKIMDTKIGTEFNSELHEAITQSPAPSEDLKGKIIDVLEKGYYLNDKVVRFAKVIIGS